MDINKRFPGYKWTIITTIVLSGCTILYCKVIPPMDYTLQKDVAALNLGSRVDLLGESLSCCASHFSMIFLELRKPVDLENFLNSTSFPVKDGIIVGNASMSKEISVVLSLGSFRTGISWLHGMAAILSRNGSFAKLKSKGVRGISLKIDEPVCAHPSSSIILAPNNISIALEIQRAAVSAGILFGLEPLPTKNPTHPCEVGVDSEYVLPSFGTTGTEIHFFLLRFNLEKIAYTYPAFTGAMENLIYGDVAAVKSVHKQSTIKIQIEVDFEAEQLELEQVLSNRQSMSAYKNLISTFTYKFAQSFHVNGERMLTVGSFEGENDNDTVSAWTQAIQFKTRKWGEIGDISGALGKVRSDNQGKVALSSIAAKHFNQLQVFANLKNFTSAFFTLAKLADELNSGRNATRKIQFQVILPIGYFGAADNPAGVVGWIVNLAAVHPGVVDAIIIYLHEKSCTSASTKFGLEQPINDFNDGELLHDVLNLLKDSEIKLGVTDCVYEKLNKSELHRKFLSKAELVLVNFEFKKSLDLLPRALDSLRLKIEYHHHHYYHRKDNVSIAIRPIQVSNSDWSTTNCRDFRLFWETVRNWARVHSRCIVNPDDVFDNSVSRASGQWYKQVRSLSPFMDNPLADAGSFLQELNDACVTLDHGPFIEPINISQSQTGISLRVDHAQFRNISLDVRVFLLQLVTLRFNVVEIVLDQLDILPQLLGGFARAIKEKREEEVQLYINLKTNINMEGSELFEAENITTHSIWLHNNTLHMVSGFHLEIPSFTNTKNKSAAFERVADILTHITTTTTPHQTKVGISLPLAFNQGDWLASMGESEFELIRMVDYTIIDVNLAKELNLSWDLANPTHILRDGRPSRFSTKLYMLFERFRGFRDAIRKVCCPNASVWLRVGWPSLVGIRSKKSTQNYLQFWKFVNDFSSAYSFPYIIYEAFGAGEALPGNFGWWEVKNYSDLANVSVYLEKEAEYLGMETLRPKSRSYQPDISLIPPQLLIPAMILLSVIGLLFVFISSTIFLVIRVRQANLVLSTLEARQFRHGFTGGFSDGGGRVPFIDREILGREYNSELEICKGEFKVAHSRVIGFGNSGLVYKTIMARYEGEVAVKIPKGTEPAAKADPLVIKSMLAEIKIMSYIGAHANVLKLLGAYTKEIQRGIVYVITEYCDHGSLVNYLRSLNPTSTSIIASGPDRTGSTQLLIDFYELKRFCTEIANGMDYIGSKNVLHGDLSARNVLLTRNKTCKISDFGLSRKLEQYQMYKKKGDDEEPLPWRWLAIESLQRLQFSVKSDVWSYGITVWEIFSLGELPFPGETWNEDYVRRLEIGLRPGPPKYACPVAYDMMMNCWILEPGDRPAFAQLAEFFRQLNISEYSSLMT